MSSPLDEGVDRLCSLLFRGEKTLEACRRILREVMEKGYVHVPWQHGLEWQVARKLRDVGVLERRRIPRCSGEQLLVTYVPDRKRLTRIRLVFEALDRSRPICIE